jgi:hypothetical protein
VSNVEPLRALAVSLSNGICGFMAFLKWPWLSIPVEGLALSGHGARFFPKRSSRFWSSSAPSAGDVWVSVPAMTSLPIFQ